MIQIYNNKHLTWDGTTSINHYELFADTVTDLPSDPYYFSSPDKGSYKMAQGSIAWVIDVSEIYMLDSGGTWVLESISGGGGGGGGTTNYNALTNKPSINSVELNGNKTLSDLGIQSAIDSSHKLSADLVSTSGTTNQFNMQADWDQSTTTAGDYIKNKPALGTAAATDATAYATAAQGAKADSAVQSAGTGLSKSGTTLNHSNSVTAKTTQGFAQIAYDAQGHITGSTAATTAQADAINSGITSTDVAQITTNKNNILYNTFLGRKNALKLQFDSSAISAYGLTFTKNADGTLTVAGTYNGSAPSYAPYIGNATLPAGIYMLSGCPSGGGESTWQLDMIAPSYVNDTGSGAQFTLTQTTTIQIRCRIATTETLNKTFYPMITLKSIYDTDSTFERYAMSNAEITDWIESQ